MINKHAKPLDIFQNTVKVQLQKLIENGYEGFNLPVKTQKTLSYHGDDEIDQNLTTVTLNPLTVTIYSLIIFQKNSREKVLMLLSKLNTTRKNSSPGKRHSKTSRRINK